MGDLLKKMSLQMRKRQVDLQPGNFNQTYHSSSYSLGADVDIEKPNMLSQFLPRIKFYLNGTLDNYTGGLGTHSADKGAPESTNDLILSFGGSLGWGHNTPINIDMLNQYSPNAITNNNDFAIIYQTNIVFKKTGFRQINASVGLRVYNFTLTSYNDVAELGLTDGNDRWWSGGVQAAWHFYNRWGLRSVTLGSDVFTGERITDPRTDKYKTFETNGRLYYEESQTDILLDRGSIYLKVTRENGQFLMIDYSGKGGMLLQDFLHDNLVHKPRFISEVPNSLMFYFGKEL